MRSESCSNKNSKNSRIITACVDGDDIDLFTAFLDDSEVKIVDVEPAGKGLDISEHSAILTLGSLGALYGFKCYLLQDEAGESLLVYSIAPSLD